MSDYWIQTFTGKKFDLERPTIEMICIEDIAHHLSIENRFCGATKFPYSVAYHSLLVASKCPPELKLEGLLDDAEETWYKDFPSPWKKLIRENLRTNLWDTSVTWTKALIETKFKLNKTPEATKFLKNIDLRMAMTEREQLCALPPEDWMPEWENSPAYTDIEILNLSADNIEKLFLKEYEKWKRV